jgi:hypothetical protein
LILVANPFPLNSVVDGQRWSSWAAAVSLHGRLGASGGCSWYRQQLARGWDQRQVTEARQEHRHVDAIRHADHDRQHGRLQRPTLSQHPADYAGYGTAQSLSRRTTPFLDKLAQTSVVFDRAFSTAPWTLPSHGSLFTGRYPDKLSVDYDFEKDPGEHHNLAICTADCGVLDPLRSALKELNDQRDQKD